MAVLYIAGDLRGLADQFAEELDQQARTRDFFAPVRVIVPNRYIRKWLRLQLARIHGVAINLHFETLETALWNLMRETDASHSAPEALDENTYRLMVLSVLLEERDASLAPLESYLQRDGESHSRLSCRRAWQLADRFASLMRNYEYARQDAFIQPWLNGHFGLPDSSAFHRTMERAQRAVFRAITREPDGKRALLNRLTGNSYRTFPQYVMERLRSGQKLQRTNERVHFFGFTEICPLHVRAIAWLSRDLDGILYVRNSLADHLPANLDAETLTTFTQRFHGAAEAGGPGWELLHRWGRAGAECIELLLPLLADGFKVQCLAEARSAKSATTVLQAVRNRLSGDESAHELLAQDTTLQIVGCPGVAREVQTVYDSILANLQRDATLCQTDIGVLTTDMATYRAPLQAVFERGQLHYNMVDFSAASASTFAQAVVGLLDLALESFSRSRVFAVLLNPCFLARLGIDRADAMTWLDWAERLGIYHGWDADEKAQQGYARSPLYSWKLGLQRMRLGRYMDISDENAAGPARRFGDVIPFADVASADHEQLDAFCRAVEGLLPALADLRSAKLSGKRWAEVLRRLVDEFLDVPADRAEEGEARAALLQGLKALASWDHLGDAEQRSSRLPLALVREYVHSQFQSLHGNHGEYLIGGVTIAELQPMRPTPFSIVYVLGLGEALFPGTNALSSFDLRGAARLPGDIGPAEARLFDFLTTLVSARSKIYLTYNNRDLVRDQDLLPCAPLRQLQRFLSDHVLSGEFQEVAVPMRKDDLVYLDPAQQPEFQDVLVQPDRAERAATILAAQRAGRLALDAEQEREWTRESRTLQKNFALAEQLVPATAPVVRIAELRRFLMLPAAESLRRHLQLEDEREIDLEDDEPLVTSNLAGGALIAQTLEQTILAASKAGVDVAISEVRARFAQMYDDARARSSAPEAAFGEIDQAALYADLAERVHGHGQIERFLRERSNDRFCGPVLIGESTIPLGARLRFPALRLRPGHELEDTEREIRIIGSTRFVWAAPGRCDLLVLTNLEKIEGEKIHATMIEPALFHLALLANAERNAEDMSSEAWLAQREFHLHVSFRGGIRTWTYPPGSITSAEAAAYFVKLTRDLLQREQFDLLPFEIVRHHVELRQAMSETAATLISAADYHRVLCEAIADDRESPHPKARIPLIVDVINARAPDDALAKVQRRFRLLDRGPARFRQPPRVSPGRQPVHA